jgi:hydrocephalus-inducing protein
VEVEVEVTFEPSTVGEAIRDALLVSSPAAGDYLCPLLGRCQPPKPLGPVLLSKNAGAVPFKNVFGQEADFVFAVDNPAFAVKAGERLGAKKATSIAVAYRAGGGGGERSTGKLTVTCPRMTGAQWVYYLQA